MNRLQPNQLPCLTTEAEQRELALACIAGALSAMVKDALASTDPVDPEITKNERLWKEGKRDEWFSAELKRIMNSKKDNA